MAHASNTVDGKVTRGKRFVNFTNLVIVAKLFRRYILNFTGINSALLESRNFSTGMQGRVLFAKLFPRVTFPVYGNRSHYHYQNLNQFILQSRRIAIIKQYISHDIAKFFYYCSAPYAYIVPYAYGTSHTRMGYPIRVWANIMSHTRMGVPYEYACMIIRSYTTCTPGIY